MTPNDPSLVIHLFVAADLPEALGELREFWDRLGTELGMTSSVVSLKLPVELPEEFPERAVAARRDRRGLHQAIIRRHDDVLCVSVALSGKSWPELDRLWAEVAKPQLSLGTVHLYTGAVPREAWPRGFEAAPRMRDLVLREDDAGPDDRPSRRFTVLFTEEGTELADRWFWNEGPSVPPVFAIHLLNAAKIRYELRVFQQAKKTRRTTDVKIRDALKVLLAPQSDPASLEARRRELLAEFVGPKGTVHGLTLLRELRMTVSIAADALIDGAGPFMDDRELAAWFVRELDDELVYAAAVHERVQATLGALTLESERALQSRRELTQLQEQEANARRNRFTLLQSAFVGAVLMILAAVQAFEYKADFLHPSLIPAVIAALGALALLFASAVLWLLFPSDQKPSAWLGALVFATFGASLGWLAAALGFVLFTGHAAATGQSWAGALAGAIAGVAGFRRAVRRWT
ncbi:CATRA conflict system CASPASE/TPR repeat-associated protein [Nonomuraea polychroma]|uniref:CATRA conflict system CASPASE/TPR repeat-associated protein n=1 Tax=Nonomuraea polychroma TaxID=46176 RepID=UPI003D912B71